MSEQIIGGTMHDAEIVAGWILLIVSSVAWVVVWVMDYRDAKHKMRATYRRNRRA